MARNYESMIAALLAKAEGTDNPHEAETYMAKAEELMLQHGIERAQLEAARTPGTKREEIVTRRIIIRNGHGYADAMFQIGGQIAPSFLVRPLKSNLADGARMLWLVGHASDVDQVEQLFTSLMAQSQAQAKAWWKRDGKQLHPYATDNDAWKARREFIYAFASGAGERLRETKNRVVHETGPGTELVLVDRSKAVDRWVDENIQFGKARASRGRDYGSYAAAQAGKQAGREAVAPRTLR